MKRRKLVELRRGLTLSLHISSWTVGQWGLGYDKDRDYFAVTFDVWRVRIKIALSRIP